LQITYLGHAGFCIEAAESIIITDPWLSPTGAFDSAWFQFPRNHHMAAVVQEKLLDSSRERYIYISHEHKDHFDIGFLNSLQCRDFTLVIPNFRRNALREALRDYECKELVVCEDRAQVPIPGGSLTLFLDDSELNRDSAILVEADGKRFLDLNDCKLFDELHQIVADRGAIDIFAAQFSGATWHPVCYDYSREVYEAISRKKMYGKFNVVVRALDILRPSVFLPSAGPACFLDPQLLSLNFEPVNIFPHNPALIAYLNRKLPHLSTKWPNLMPGDILDVETSEFTYLAPQRVDETNYVNYVNEYASHYEGFFKQRKALFTSAEREMLLERLRGELVHKLGHLTLRERIRVPLYFRLDDTEGKSIRVDFVGGAVDIANEIKETDFYSITAPSWEVARVLDRKLTWEDFALTFRVRLNREPDTYQALIQAFLIMESDDLNWFCAKTLEIEANQERVVIEAEGCRFSVNRFCPHQGGDLTEGWVEQGRYLTCPRHRWQFDLQKDGVCLTNDTSVHAMALEDS
jgi:UDP-MurNAc hydroxylase